MARPQDILLRRVLVVVAQVIGMRVGYDPFFHTIDLLCLSPNRVMF